MMHVVFIKQISKGLKKQLRPSSLLTINFKNTGQLRRFSTILMINDGFHQPATVTILTMTWHWVSSQTRNRGRHPERPPQTQPMDVMAAFVGG